MTNDEGLVDEFERLQNFKKEIDEKIEKLKEEIIILAKERNADVLFGTNKKCSIKEYEKVIYPEDKIQLVELIRKKGLYDKFSSINYFKLNPVIVKGDIDPEILNLIKKERAFKVFLIAIKK